MPDTDLAPAALRGPGSQAVLTIDLAAMVENWRRLKRQVGVAEVAAVVKADAYGLGAAAVAGVLSAAGCRSFFVATVDEGMALRTVVADASIIVLHTLDSGGAAECLGAGLTPVLNDGGEIERWLAACRRADRPAPAWLHVDTGLNRLGIAQPDAIRLADQSEVAGFPWAGVMSHLACADAPRHSKNCHQLCRFRAVRRALPFGRASLAASSGIFLGADYHYDVVRPGAAIYGLNPVPGRPNPMKPTVLLQAKILQIRCVDLGETVGYGAARVIAAPTRIGVVAAGYADGFRRAAGESGKVYVGEYAAPVIGRVSMDLLTVDFSRVPEAAAYPGAWVELIGPRASIDGLAAAAGTAPYEILTGLGRRFERRYPVQR